MKRFSSGYEFIISNNIVDHTKHIQSYSKRRTCALNRELQM